MKLKTLHVRPIKPANQSNSLSNSNKSREVTQHFLRSTDMVHRDGPQRHPGVLIKSKVIEKSGTGNQKRI